jgi:hypothetical protein
MITTTGAPPGTTLTATGLSGRPIVVDNGNGTGTLSLPHP